MKPKKGAEKKDTKVILDYIEKPICFGSMFVEADLDKIVYSKYMVLAKTDCHMVEVTRRAFRGIIQRI